jgi:hypothetical protein
VKIATNTKPGSEVVKMWGGGKLELGDRQECGKLGDRQECRKYGILLREGLNLLGTFIVLGKLDRKFGQSRCENG